MTQKEYRNYYKNHGGYGNSSKIDQNILKIRLRNATKNFDRFFEGVSRDAHILEIGCGQGYFAEYLSRKGFSNYVGFDFDSQAITDNKITFPQYSFSDEDVNHYLLQNKDKIDIVFMSHVYEHCTVDEGYILASNIYNSLAGSGFWLNIMPNAGAIHTSMTARYFDITHKVLYTSHSMSQQLQNAGFQNKNIKHYNTVFPFLVFEYWVKFYALYTKFLYRSLGYLFDSIYTFEIITIAKK